MSEITQEQALRQADAVVTRAVQQTEARCAVLGQFIDDCAASGSRPTAWNDALRELHALQGYRAALLRRRSLILQALEYPVGECPATVSLPPSPPSKSARPTQRQVQVQVQRRRSRT